METKRMMLDLFRAHQLGSFFVNLIEMRLGKDINTIRRRIAVEKRAMETSFICLVLTLGVAIYISSTGIIQFMPRISMALLALMYFFSISTCLVLFGRGIRGQFQRELGKLAEAVRALAFMSNSSEQTIAQMHEDEFEQLAETTLLITIESILYDPWAAVNTVMLDYTLKGIGVIVCRDKVSEAFKRAGESF